MKKFIASLVSIVIIMTCIFTCGALASSRVPCAEDYSATGTKTYILVKKTIAMTNDGEYMTLYPEQEFVASRIYLTKKGEIWVYGKLKTSGDTCYILSRHLRTEAGKKIPKLKSKITLKEDFRLEGEVCKKGKKLKVKYYAYSPKGKIMAYCYEGFIPRSFWR